MQISIFNIKPVRTNLVRKQSVVIMGFIKMTTYVE